MAAAHDGNPRRAGVTTPDAALLQVAAHARSRFQPECAAAGQQDAVCHGVDVQRIERGSLLGAAGRSANVHAADGPLLAQNGGASGNRLEIRDVADAGFRGCP